MNPGGNPQNLKPFKKGDARINRNGRPKSFDTLRKLAQQIAHEEARNKEGQTLQVNGHLLTVTEAILRQWATSKDPKIQQRFIEYAFGKVPDRADITSDGKALTIKVELSND